MNCLDATTFINTTAGLFTIESLVGREDVTVKAWNPATRQRENVLATNIRKTHTNRAMLCLTLDNHTIIRCTADHLFRAFISGVETEVTANQLQEMVHVELRGLGCRPRVVDVQDGLGEHPTYSLDAGDVGWFFANNVLCRSGE